ncbi:hypothetical protein KBZ21_56010, partial [Streptomyces sp. A73]|nr:hypothetical protein [Streptomyces sp. A73]
EFYGAPQRYILGASESAFQDAEGNTKSAWETYIGRVLALERDTANFRAHDGCHCGVVPIFRGQTFELS